MDEVIKLHNSFHEEHHSEHLLCGLAYVHCLKTMNVIEMTDFWYLFNQPIFLAITPR